MSRIKSVVTRNILNEGNSTHQSTRLPMNYGERRTAYKRVFQEYSSALGSCAAESTSKRTRRSSKSCSSPHGMGPIFSAFEFSDVNNVCDDFLETLSREKSQLLTPKRGRPRRSLILSKPSDKLHAGEPDSCEKPAPHTPKRGRPRRQSTPAKRPTKGSVTNSAENIPPCGGTPTVTPRARRVRGGTINKSNEEHLATSAEIEPALMTPTGKERSSKASSDTPIARRHRKSAIVKFATEDSDAISEDNATVGLPDPSTNDVSGKLPKWLENEPIHPSTKPLETIFEGRPLEVHKKAPLACTKAPKFLTPSRVTRLSTVAKSAPPQKAADSWSKTYHPRELIFVAWEEVYPSEGQDENWNKLREKLTKDKRQRLLSKLRAMNKRPGDAFRVSEDTEKHFAEFWSDFLKN